MDCIPICEDIEPQSRCIRLALLEEFPQWVQEMAERCEIYGAHQNEQGKVVIVDIWNEHHETEVDA